MKRMEMVVRQSQCLHWKVEGVKCVVRFRLDELRWSSYLNIRDIRAIRG
jgi:hypothetical protein